jgi:magnesium transporter
VQEQFTLGRGVTMQRTSIYTSADGGNVFHDPSQAEMEAQMAHPDTRIWMDLIDPTPEELTFLERSFGILHLTTEDLSRQGQRAKLEEFDNYTYIVAFDMHYENGAIVTREVDLLIGATFLITSHRGTLASEEERDRLEQRLPRIMARGMDYLMYVFLDTLVDRYFPALDAFSEAIDTLEDAIVTDPTPEVLQTIFTMKRNVVQIRKVINPQLEMFNRLISTDFGVVQDDHIVYFRDIYDHLIRIFEVVDAYRDQMASALDAYLSMTSNRMNDVMKRLTVVAAIFLPLSFLTGVFGMNFGDQPWVQHDPGWLFYASVIVMVVLTVIQIAFYRRRRYI